MTKKLFKVLTFCLLLLSALVLTTQPALAQITNPVISEELGGNAAEASAGLTFVRYFVSLWRAIMSVGALLVLVYFLWAAIEWITAGGDSGKVGKARDKITQSILGLIILVSSTLIIGFISRLFFGSAFNILSPNLPDNLQLEGSAGGSGTKLPGGLGTAGGGNKN